MIGYYKRIRSQFFFILLGLTPLCANAQWTQLGLDIDGEAVNDISGNSVSMSASGDRLAIGAPGNDGNGNRSGHVRIYEWSGAIWTQMGADLDGEAVADEFGSSVFMNGVGDRLVIGAHLNDGNANNAGHVQIYEWNGTTWIQMGADIDGDTVNDFLGKSVSMNYIGNRVAIGANGGDGGGTDAGHVRVYEWDTTSMVWTQLGSDINGEARFDQSGLSVSLNAAGNLLAIGASSNDGNGGSSGHVRIYEWDTTTIAWVQKGSDIDGEAAGDGSGRSINLNAAGSRLAIGAPNNDGNGSRSGHVRVYEWDTTITTWTQMGVDIDGEASIDFSGSSISLNGLGNQLAIGATGNDGIGSNAGHVRIYEWDTTSTSWIQKGVDIDGEAIGDLSGYSISINNIGDRLVIGAISNSGSGSGAGHVRVYQYNLTTAIDELNSEQLYLIYPNPTSGILTIETQRAMGETVQLISITGTILLEFQTSQEEEMIDMRRFQSGVYFLKVGEQIQKVVVSQ